MTTTTGHPKQLVRINRGKYISLDQTCRIEYVIYRGGQSEWIISEQITGSAYFAAVDHALTLEDARAKYVARVSA